jgi:peptidyl-prolyl cis-trans isomerase D
MLNGLRRAGQSIVGKIIATVLFGILIVSFAIWGIGDIFRATPQNVVAKVGRTEISVDQFRTAFNREIQRLNRRFGGRLTTETARSFGFDRQVLGRLVNEAVLDEEARDLGLSVSDQLVAKSILDSPAFKDSRGEFNRALFENVLRDAGLSEGGFVRDQRLAVARDHLTDAVAGSLPVPIAAREAQNRYVNERRTASYLVLPPAAAGDVPAPTPEQLQTFYDERKASFRAPERRTITVLTVDADALARPGEVSDADARQRYEQSKASYGAPERRTVQQIVFPSNGEAETALARIREGASLESIAAERGISAQDLELGTFAKSDMLDPAVADAVFALAEGAVSAPVEGRFGTVLVRAAKVQPETVKPYEEVVSEVKRQIAQERARALVDRIHDEIEDLRAAAKPLAEAAREKGLAAVQLPAVDESGQDKDGKPVANIPESAALLRAAFASDVGVDNEALRIRSGGHVWYDVTGIEPARDRPLDEVRAEVEGQWRSEEVSRRLSDRARSLVLRLDGGEPIEKVAGSDGLTVKNATDLARGQARDDLSAQAVTRIFATPVGKAGSAANGTDSRAVFKVTGARVPALLTTTQQAHEAEGRLREQLGDTMIAEYIAQAQSRVPVTINERAFRLVVGGGDG